MMLAGRHFRRTVRPLRDPGVIQRPDDSVLIELAGFPDGGPLLLIAELSCAGSKTAVGFDLGDKGDTKIAVVWLAIRGGHLPKRI